MSSRISGIGMTSQRTRMRMIERLREQGIVDEAVLNVMNEIPRHIFVEEALASRAYEDIALPLGFGQTISQPYIVARMTELLTAGKPLGKVLEIGTGCGYQTAILARLATEVYSVERLQPLLAMARKNLRELRISNIRFKHADGHAGIPEAAPFDAILVTAAATHVPEVLKKQLAVGGRMVVPMGAREQHLCVIERTARGFSQARLDTVRFVPMLSGLS
ncbi:MAG: protein-L-isoaspartate(D-aspartate) O-methyltransferase [Betaproteobacteria bacterium]|nr:protein-L-isoaspartate(D-aspartate) O-methyltransferase [Betaproteobacteria bacterium]